MLYIINILFSCLYLSQIKAKRLSLFLIKVIPVILLWVFIVGGQYKIGADYDAYLSYFLRPNSESRFEPLFSGLSEFLYNNGIVGQGQFYIYALINAVIVFIASYRLGIKNWGLFYFLLITVSTYFNNQMNGLRQCTAVAIAYWGFVELYNSKIKGISLVAIASGFHYSAVICLLFTFFKRVTNFLTRYPKILLLASGLISLFSFEGDINQDLIELLPDEINDATTYEQMYANDDSMSAAPDMIYKISKLILLPLYLFSVRLLKGDALSDKEMVFCRFGILSYSLRCLLLFNQLLARLSYYFWIPSIIPIYYLCVNLYQRKRIDFLSLILIYSSVLYFIKVIMGVAEYKSSFIYFQ